MEKDYQKNALLFKGLADATRLQIVDMLREGELCACVILESFNITQPTLSYHMKILTECGLVNARREGAWMKYTVNMDSINEIKTMFCDYKVIEEINYCECNEAEEKK